MTDRTPQEPTAQEGLRAKVAGLFNRANNSNPSSRSVNIGEAMKLLEAEASRRERAAEERLLDELEKVAQAYHNEPYIDKAREKLAVLYFDFIAAKRQALKEKET